MSVDLEVAVARCAAGLPVDPATVPPRARRSLAVAERLGAPRADVLRAASASLAAEEELARAVAVAAAEGRSVARALVLAPPVVGPFTALLVTDEPFAVWATPLGRTVLVLAACLWLAGAGVVRRLVRSALRPARSGAGPSPELLDLVGIALLGGLTLPAALRLAAAEGPAQAAGRTSAAAMWLELGARGPSPGGWESVGPRLAAAAADGVPLAPLVAALAAAARSAEHQRSLQCAARLGARLTLPTTLLLLPAAMLVVAAPLLHGALGLLG